MWAIKCLGKKYVFLLLRVRIGCVVNTTRVFVVRNIFIFVLKLLKVNVSAFFIRSRDCTAAISVTHPMDDVSENFRSPM